jgi:hypothetical protein
MNGACICQEEGVGLSLSTKTHLEGVMGKVFIAVQKKSSLVGVHLLENYCGYAPMCVSIVHYAVHQRYYGYK